MPEPDAAPLPVNCQWLIRVASWILPCSRRGEWRRHWEHHIGHWHAFLMEHGQWDRDARVQLLRHCWKAFPDAFWARFDREQVPLQLRRFFGSPRFCVYALLAFLLVIAVATNGLSHIRKAFSPLPYPSPERLVLCSQTSALHYRTGVPIVAVRLWQDESKTLAGLAGWYLRPVRLSPRHRNLVAARITPSFFAVLGTGAFLGRTFRPEDASADPVPMLLSHRLWREEFQADPVVVGRRLTVGDRTAVVVGVLPGAFWAITQRIEVWLPFQLDPYAGPPFLVGAVARLQPGVARDQAQAELRALAGRHRRYGTGTELSMLEQRVRPSARAVAAALLPSLALVALGVLLVAGGLTLAALGRGSLRYAWRYWSFFALKTALILAGLAAVWVELKCAAILNLNSLADPGVVTMLGWLFLVVSVGALCLSVHDQRRRCPVCLYRLALPVTIGSWSSALFEPARTELLCEQGHGTLCVPGTDSSASESERWQALDDSWREMFSEPKP